MSNQLDAEAVLGESRTVDADVSRILADETAQMYRGFQKEGGLKVAGELFVDFFQTIGGWAWGLVRLCGSTARVLVRSGWTASRSGVRAMDKGLVKLSGDDVILLWVFRCVAVFVIVAAVLLVTIF